MKRLIALLTVVMLVVVVGRLNLSTSRSEVLGEIEEHGVHVTNRYPQEAYEKVFLNAAPVEVSGVVFGLNVPHHLLAATMIAQAYKSLMGRQEPAVVVVIGPNHFVAGRGEIISSLNHWETVYGLVKPAEVVIENLLKQQIVSVEPEAMDPEHAMSVQMPFIKRTFPAAYVVPLILRPGVAVETLERTATALHEVLPKNSLIIGSVDFTHHTTQKDAYDSDMKTIEALRKADLESLLTMQTDSNNSLYLLYRLAELRKSSEFQLIEQADGSHFTADFDPNDLTSYVTFYLHQ